MPNSSNGDSDFWSVSSQGSAIQPTKFPVSSRNCAPFRFYACIEKLLMLLCVQWVLIYENIICLRSLLPAVICLLWWKDQRGSFQGCLDSRPGCIEKLDVRHLLFIRCHDFRTAPTFFRQLLLGGHDTKNGAGALSWYRAVQPDIDGHKVHNAHFLDQPDWSPNQEVILDVIFKYCHRSSKFWVIDV